MLSYLTAETSFVRAFGNRSLLLLLMCVLVRSGHALPKASVIGLSIDLNPAVIAALGPIVALLLLIALKGEADTLLLAREAVLEEASELRRVGKVNRWLYALFVVPALACAYMSLQYILKLVPLNAKCQGWDWVKQLTDFTYQGGTPSIYCIGDLVDGTPWIYPPLQSYIYLACVLTCGYLTFRIIEDWRKERGGRPPGSTKL